jgi:hypothetical protein
MLRDGAAREKKGWGDKIRVPAELAAGIMHPSFTLRPTHPARVDATQTGQARRVSAPLHFASPRPTGTDTLRMHDV